MSKLEEAILTLQEMQSTNKESVTPINAICGIIVTVIYLIAMLSVAVDRIGMLLWFALYPIAASPMLGMSFNRVFKKSLIALPFIAFIGIFNPVFDTAPALTVGSVVVSRGWVTFASIVLRGLMSVQAIVMLVDACGFEGLCRGLRKLGLPGFLVTQLLMVYRYMTVLLIELLAMRRARESRSYGNTRLSLKMWGHMTGQLFIRTVSRAERINRAMLARGFKGTLPLYKKGDSDKLRRRDIVFTAAWIAVFVVLRFTNLSAII